MFKYIFTLDLITSKEKYHTHGLEVQFLAIVFPQHTPREYSAKSGRVLLQYLDAFLLDDLFPENTAINHTGLIVEKIPNLQSRPRPILFLSLVQFAHQLLGVLIPSLRQQLLNDSIVFDNLLAPSFVRQLLDLVASGQILQLAPSELTIVFLLAATPLLTFGSLFVHFDDRFQAPAYFALHFGAQLLGGDLLELFAAQYVQ